MKKAPWTIQPTVSGKLMPVYELNCPSVAKDGKTPVNPRDILTIAGPSLVISVSSIHAPIVTINGIALLDTGAVATAIDESVCQQLNLPPVDVARVSHVEGSSRRTCYAARIAFPDLRLKPIQITRILSVNLSAMNPPIIALIGRDLLAHFKFIYNGPRGRIEIAY